MYKVADVIAGPRAGSSGKYEYLEYLNSYLTFTIIEARERGYSRSYARVSALVLYSTLSNERFYIGFLITMTLMNVLTWLSRQKFQS